ncbi:hypothetical protein QJS04_geneDACA024946 [Acorus gramineus]|uniref:Uncharacterized protein n=1 Tax=Acorus gramineus TaxID=55184 RepID=A0AAV8ZXU3_ACOGR|nr:hypothetical protein QJS04_geneDACA024946 [Acorus gramineus]
MRASPGPSTSPLGQLARACGAARAALSTARATATAKLATAEGSSPALPTVPRQTRSRSSR